MDKKTKKVLFSVITAALGILLFTYAISKFPILGSLNMLLKAPIMIVLLYFATSFIIILTTTVRWSIILHSQNCYVPLGKLFSYKMVDYGVSFLTPFAKLGGAPLRATMIQRDGVDIAKGASSTIIDKFLELSLNGFFFIIGLMFFIFAFKFSIIIRAVISLLCLLVMLLIIYVYVKVFKSGECVDGLFCRFKLRKVKFFRRNEKKIKETEGLMVQFFRQDKKHFSLTVLVTLIALIFMFVEYKAALFMLGYNLNPHEIFTIFSVVGMAYVIPVPLALGTLEASQVNLFKLLGLGGAAGLALALLIKFRELVMTAIGIFFLSIYGLGFKKTYNKVIDDVEEEL